MAQGAAAAKGDGTGGHCGTQGGDNGTGECSTGRRGLLGSKSMAGAARATCLYFQETIQHPACSSPSSARAAGELRLGESPAPCGNARRGHHQCPPEQLLLQNEQLVLPAPLGTLCSPQVTALGSGASPNSAPCQALPPQFVLQGSFQGGDTRNGDPSEHRTNTWRSSQGKPEGDRK